MKIFQRILLFFAIFPSGLLFELIIPNHNPSKSELIGEFDLDRQSLLPQITEEVNKKFIQNNEINPLELIYSSKYSLSLQKHLIEKNDKLSNDPTSIIIIFEENSSKKERNELIKELFEQHKIIYEFSIIPGIYLKCNSLELKLLEPVIRKSKIIIKVFKENVQTIPKYFKIEQNSLDATDWENWWIPAIGGSDLSFNGSGINVSIIDTGISSHPDFASRIIKQRNFASEGEKVNPFDYSDRNGHGTHVAGIIGGNGNVSSGKYRGVATAVKLINAKAANSSGSLKDADVVKAIEWSVENGAQIISMSFGSTYPEVFDPITLAITNASNQGIVCVVSSGNAGPGYYTGGSPASGVNAIAVGSMDKDGDLSSFSSWGPTNSYLFYPDVCAPGENIVSTESINSLISNEQRYIEEYIDYSGSFDYVPLSGTSMACPMVSGALALLLQTFPGINPHTAKIALIEGAYKTINHEDLKFGGGIINISNSIKYLSEIVLNKENGNNVTSIYPNRFPIKPFDFLNYPGDFQVFNSSLISGINRNITFQIPTHLSDIKIGIDKIQIEFNAPGVEYVSISTEILLNATPGIETLTINMTDSDTGEKLDQIVIRVEKKVPEYEVLYESFHGLNDWLPEYSFKQIDFYESMKKVSSLNCSINFKMDKWTPLYNSSINGSILTAQKLSQYDLIVLQNPILPYSQSEFNAIKDYFDNGGNILFLGTRYQEICSQNINSLFNFLNAGIIIKEENIENVTHVGIGAFLDSNDVMNFTAGSAIFNGVSKFYWLTGCSFEASGCGLSQAKIYNKTVVASCDKYSEGKGKILAFGDLYWLLDGYYNHESYFTDHSKLLQNVIEFLLPQNNISLNIGTKSGEIYSNYTELAIYIKNQTTDGGIVNLVNGSSLNITLTNPITKDVSNITLINLGKGVYYNNSINLNDYSYLQYRINVSIGIVDQSYFKEIMFIHPNKSEIPEFEKYSITYSEITRKTGEYNYITINLNKIDCNLTAYMGIHPISFFNSGKAINKTLGFQEISEKTYKSTFIPNSADTAGYAFFYLIPRAPSNYTNTNSDRLYFKIENNSPKINTSLSYFGALNKFEDTQENDSLLVQDLFILTNYEFHITANESVDYEDNNSEFRVFINFFMVTVSTDGIISLMYPSDFAYLELNYDQNLMNYGGAFQIPASMNYTSFNATVQKSVLTSIYEPYYGLFYITIVDTEGGSDDFFIVMELGDSRIDPYLIIAIIIIVGVIAGIIILFLILSRKSRYYEREPSVPSNEYGPYQSSYNDYASRVDSAINYKFCPFCGQMISKGDSNCRFCGRDIQQI